jgi:hypothetical protein
MNKTKPINHRTRCVGIPALAWSSLPLAATDAGNCEMN